MTTISQRRDPTPIFAAVANDYYKAGMSVIPLVYHEKKPIPDKWSRFADEQPDVQEFAAWMRDYPNGNIGVVLGKQSNMSVIDIDLDLNDEKNQRIVQIIEQALPKSPWTRIGKKGKVLAFQYTDIPTFRIKDAAGKTLIEYLSARTQVVVPPSIHPQTGVAYQANCDLLSVKDALPRLPNDIEDIIRGVLKDNNVPLALGGGRTRVTDWTAAGARDSKMIQVAGAYANGVLRGERPLMESIQLMRGWHEGFVEKIAGDPIDIEKGIQRLVEFIIHDVKDRGRALPKGWDEGLQDEDRRAMHLDFSDDQVEWDYDQIKDYIRDEFERHPEGSYQRTESINKALTKIGQNTGLNSIDQDRLIKYIVDASKEKLTISSLKTRLRELGQGDVMGQDHTEIARAVITDLEKYGKVRSHGERIWEYQGSHWVEKDRQDMLKLIAEQYGSLPMAKKESDHKQILNIVRTLLPKGIQSLNIKGVNFANGFLGQDGQLYKHDSAHGATYTLPFRFLPEAAGRCPKFFDFLHQAWSGDEDYNDKILALQEAICVTIFGMGPRFQRAILCEGAAKSGKSQLLEIVKHLVPPEARSSVPPDTWGDKFAPTMMYNKILNLCGELPDDKYIEGQSFKGIVSGEEITMQYKQGQLFQGATQATHWFASNSLPKTRDTSEGFNRRWLILRFNRPVRPEKRILDYGEVIATEEREGIAAWAVEALPRLLIQNEYTLPSSHKERVGEMANANNSVRYFVTDSQKVKIVPFDEDGDWKDQPYTSEFKLHGAYWSFCLGPGASKPFGVRPFRSKMRDFEPELGFKIKMVAHPNGANECIYLGVVLDGKQ